MTNFFKKLIRGVPQAGANFKRGFSMVFSPVRKGVSAIDGLAHSFDSVFDRMSHLPVLGTVAAEGKALFDSTIIPAVDFVDSQFSVIEHSVSDVETIAGQLFAAVKENEGALDDFENQLGESISTAKQLFGGRGRGM